MALPKGKAAELALHFDNEKHGRREGKLYYREFSHSNRVNRAILSLVYCWIAAALTLPIFLLHWITVPGFLIAGVVLFFQQLRSKTHVQRAVGCCPVDECPSEGKEVTIRLNHHHWPPVWVHCPECHHSLHLVADKSVEDIEEAIE